jgi:hypothetical protein
MKYSIYFSNSPHPHDAWDDVCYAWSFQEAMKVYDALCKHCLHVTVQDEHYNIIRSCRNF